MIATAVLRQTFTSLGYKPSNIVTDYRFAAVNIAGNPVVATDAAVFFDEPPSYRNAAIGVVHVAAGEDAATAVQARRTLGAPFFIAIDGRNVSAWVVSPDGARKVGAAAMDNWNEFVSEHQAKWHAQAVRRAKAIQIREPALQQVLFDPAVVYAIQEQVQLALSNLLERFLQRFATSDKSQLSIEHDYRVLFPLVFRMLAAKILFDREDRRIGHIDRHDVKAVVDFISQLYSLPPLSLRWSRAQRVQLESAWQTLLDGLYVRNIAADDLAFVYENTLITPETRRDFGTHSTPAAVAEYVVRSLDLPSGDELLQLNVYEPFAGSCVFLTAAMRRFKELLPQDWSASVQHRHLVTHFAASELDQFACEIARLSLILADYPNANGWHIHNEDLFDGVALARRLARAQIVLCNPPFEDFDLQSGTRSMADSVHKPIEALNRFIEAAPRYLGVVMPQGFNSHKKYQELLAKALNRYADVELLALPENTFAHASVGAVVLIAQKPRSDDQSLLISLRRSVVHRRDFPQFERTLKPSLVEVAEVPSAAAPALQLLDPLREVWDYLQGCPRLGDVALIHRGLEWNIDQSLASSPRASKGRKLGLHRLRTSLAQFRILEPVFLEAREEFMRRDAQLPWHLPKVVCSAVRLSRGPWRIAAAVDTGGLLLSQQFFGIWPKTSDAGIASLEAIAAVLNSPVANAYSRAHDPEKRLRVSTMAMLPLPKSLTDPSLHGLIEEYRSLAGKDGPLFGGGTQRLSELLMAIDAAVLAAYDLPPKLEKLLLKDVGSHGRPCGHPFDPYPGLTEPGAIPLRQRLALRGQRFPLSRSAWAEILAPLPDDVADVFEAV